MYLYTSGYNEGKAKNLVWLEALQENTIGFSPLVYKYKRGWDLQGNISHLWNTLKHFIVIVAFILGSMQLFNKDIISDTHHTD